MKSSVVLLLTLFVGTAVAQQQRTTADIIGEGFMRGRQIRQAAEERKALAAKRERDRTAAEFEAAFNTPWLVFKSRNGLPDIVVSDKAVSACGQNFPAFTQDARGELINGCARPSGDQLKVIWFGYGERAYDQSEWEQKAPADADHAPLGSH